MKKTDILNKVRFMASRAGLKLKKHSPEILIAVGIVGTVTSTVLACKATTKISGILEESKESIDAVHKAQNGELIVDGKPAEYSEDDGKKDLTIIYAKTALNIAKHYAPAVLVGGFSIACFITSNNIMRKRFAAVAAAYAAVDKSFKEYRKRVTERFGDEVDHELRYNVKAETIQETTVDKNGKEVTVEKTVKTVDPNSLGAYARIFDEFNENWSRDPETNLFFLRSHQEFLNQKLRADGHLFLNDVYLALGFPITPAGQLVGWIYSPDDPKHDGDNYVDFGLYDGDKERVNAFVNGYEKSVVLNFNVDGIIYDLI